MWQVVFCDCTCRSIVRILGHIFNFAFIETLIVIFILCSTRKECIVPTILWLDESSWNIFYQQCWIHIKSCSLLLTIFAIWCFHLMLSKSTNVANVNTCYLFRHSILHLHPLFLHQLSKIYPFVSIHQPSRKYQKQSMAWRSTRLQDWILQ